MMVNFGGTAAVAVPESAQILGGGTLYLY